jgi:hypothetical protein
MPRRLKGITNLCKPEREGGDGVVAQNIGLMSADAKRGN